ncbi:MAG: hypothetical protein COA47_05315 [Robiginitomaculum sp.]|nr:MAG: hypothetical protein COA47_05315 [Robiginitomaculum sp.]
MNLELAVSYEPSIDGEVVKNSFDTTGTAQLLTTGYSDAYNEGLRYQAGISYALSDTVEVTASGNYSKASGNIVGAGTAGVDPITAQFSDLKSYGGEIGVRKYFRNKTFATLLSPAVSPYIGASVGVQQIEAANASLSSAGFGGIGQPANFSTQLYADSTVPTAQLTIGAEWRASRNFAIGIESGIRYTGALNAGDGTLLALGFEEADSHAENLTIPITLRGRFKF